MEQHENMTGAFQKRQTCTCGSHRDDRLFKRVNCNDARSILARNLNILTCQSCRSCYKSRAFHFFDGQFPPLFLWMLTMTSSFLSWILTTEGAIVIACFIFALYRVVAASRNKCPPGPRSLPLIGNVLQIPTDKQEQVFADWGAQYGFPFPPCFRIYGR